MPGPAFPPAGFSPFFIPQNFVDVTAPPALLADAIHPATGEYLSITRGFDPTDAAVCAALGIIRGTGAAVMETGQRVSDAKKVLPETSRFLRQEVELALKHLVDSQQIRLVDVSTRIADGQNGEDWAELVVKYTNLSRGEDRAAVVPLASSFARAA